MQNYIVIPNNMVANWKYTKIEMVSTSVLMSGADIIAGSSFNLVASIGSILPINLAIITVAIILIAIKIASVKSL